MASTRSRKRSFPASQSSPNVERPAKRTRSQTSETAIEGPAKRTRSKTSETSIEIPPTSSESSKMASTRSRKRLSQASQSSPNVERPAKRPRSQTSETAIEGPAMRTRSKTSETSIETQATSPQTTATTVSSVSGTLNSNSSTNQNAPVNPNPRTGLRSLPHEVLTKIFRHELHRSEGLPNLVLAMHGDDVDPQTGIRYLYDVAQRAFRACNLRVTSQNFNQIMTVTRGWSKRMSRYDHIEIVAPIQFLGSPFTVTNHFETVSLDLTSPEWQNSGLTNSCAGSQAMYLISASTCARKLIMKTVATEPDSHYENVVHLISDSLALQPKEIVSGAGVKYWMWEKDDGGKFSGTGQWLHLRNRD